MACCVGIDLHGTFDNHTLLLVATMNFEGKKFRTISNKPPIVHKRKKCQCGRIVTAKQLTIYGGV